MNRKHCIVLILLLAASPLAAQEVDTADWHIHLSTGISVSRCFGQTQSLSWVAPSFEFHPNDRLTINTGFVAAGSLMPSGYKLQGIGQRSLAPLRQGTRAAVLWAEAEYKVNPRLLVWGAVAHASGFAQPLWLDHSLPLQATAFSGGMDYRIGENSILEMHIHIIKDNTYPLGSLWQLGPLYL